MKTNKTILVVLALAILLSASSALGFRLIAPSSNTCCYSRASWEATPGNIPFRPRGILNLNINGVAVNVDFGAGGAALTAQQVAATIRAAIAAQAPGSATVSVVGTGLGSGSVRIVPTVGTVTVLGGNANRNLRFNTWGNPPATTLDPWDQPPFVHWDLREFPDCKVPYAVNPNAANTLLGAAALTAAVDAAFQAWENVVPAVIQFDRADPPAWVPGQDYFRNDRWNVVSWGFLGTWSFPGPSGQSRFRWDNRTGKLLESDIILNDGGRYRWVNTGQDWVNDLDPGPNRVVATDIEGVMAHEIGHFIGLAHVPGPGAANDPTMSYGRDIWGRNLWSVPNTQLRSLEFDDRDGCNFLYTPDLGDAPDPLKAFNFYPSLVHGPIQWATLNDIDLFQPALGADHFFGIRDSNDNLYRNGDYQYEWLGAHIDDHTSECEARVPDQDEYDDGVEFLFDAWGRLVGTRFDVWTNGHGPDRYDNTTGGWLIYVNGWLDIDYDQWWAHPGEHLVDWSGGPGHGAWPGGDVRRIITRYFAPVLWPDDAYFRMRLDWGEQVGRTHKVDYTLNNPIGAAQLGEVEDYPKPADYSPFHGWHYGFDTIWSGWPLWDYPGIYWNEADLTLHLDAPWWWLCYYWPPPVSEYRFGIAVPQTFLDAGWWIQEVAFKEYSPVGGGTTQAVLYPNEDVGIELNGDFPMGDGTIWFGYSLYEWDLPETTMVMFYTLKAPDGWAGYISGEFHYIAGDNLYGWSPELYTNIHVQVGDYLCGDADCNTIVEITDAVYLINYVFVPGSPAPDPYESGDVDCNTIVEITDAVYLISYVFVPGSPAPCDPDGDGEPDC